MPDRDGRRVLHGRRHCKPAGDLPSGKAVRRARDGGRRARTGRYGEGGRGTASYYGLEDQVDVYMGTFSKSAASLGGYMAASSRVADYVRHNSRPFIFSASIPPANCAAALAALRELEAHPELVTKLQKNALYLRKRLSEEHIRMRESNGEIVPIIPIYTYEPVPTLTIAKELYDAGVYVNSSLPPAAAPHECLLRTSPDGNAHDGAD